MEHPFGASLLSKLGQSGRFQESKEDAWDDESHFGLLGNVIRFWIRSFRFCEQQESRIANERTENKSETFITRNLFNLTVINEEGESWRP